MKEWKKMPSFWIRDKEAPPLKNFKWDSTGANQTAALILYIVLVHHANDEPSKNFPGLGFCSLSYSELGDIAGLSRAKISAGLNILYDMKLISKEDSKKQNIYKVTNYEQQRGWAKLPARGLYSKELKKVYAFHRFNLRSKVELYAMKIYLLLVAQRNNQKNYAEISYENINFYTGVHRNDIRSALSLLVGLGLIHIDNGVSDSNGFTTNLYRLCYLETHRHRGTLSSEQLEPSHH